MTATTMKPPTKPRPQPPPRPILSLAASRAAALDQLRKTAALIRLL